MIKQAVILCAGLGTRLQPYTDTMPKVMIPILSKPMLEWNILQFKKYGIQEFFINLHYLPDVIKDYFGDGASWGVKINYHFEPEILGTAGALKAFKNLDQSFFLIYGDVFSLVDYRAMEKAWHGKKDAVGIQLVQKTENYADADVAEISQKGEFIAIHPKPHPEKYVNAHRMRGVFILKKRILSYIPDDLYYEIGKDLLPNLLRHHEKFYGYESGDYSKGVDTKEKWDEVEEYLKKWKIRPLP